MTRRRGRPTRAGGWAPGPRAGGTQTAGGAAGSPPTPPSHVSPYPEPPRPPHPARPPHACAQPQPQATSPPPQGNFLFFPPPSGYVPSGSAPDKRRRAPRALLFRRALQDGGHAGGARAALGRGVCNPPGLTRGLGGPAVGPERSPGVGIVRTDGAPSAGVAGGGHGMEAAVGSRWGLGGPEAVCDAVFPRLRPNGRTRSSPRSSRTRSGPCWARAARRSCPATIRTSASASRHPRRYGQLRAEPRSAEFHGLVVK